MYKCARLLGACICLSLVVNGDRHNANPIVATSLGDIKGSILTTLLGTTIYSFKGIHYAKAPIGKLRFQPPVPVDKWDGVYDATKDGPMCPQPDLTPISEDCLSLNVYSTKLPSQHHNPKRPVMFFIHPGGFYSMGSSSTLYGPQYILDQNIVLVMINYRLGSLGFLSTGDKLAPGNNGFKDQVVALKWVKRHIAAFGGDPNLVTIAGCSAGGVSVTAHMLSPMSRGLFHRAIAMSDTTFAQWPLDTHLLDLAQKQARLVGCPDDTSENIINCLNTKSGKELGDTLSGFAEFGIDPVLLWRPVIELDFGQERFLTEHPIKTALKGNFQNVPIMTGITTEEFFTYATVVFGVPALLKEMDEDFERVAPISFIYERNTTKSKYVSKELRKAFLGDGPLTNSSFTGVGQLYADGAVAFGVNRGVKLLAAKNTRSTYYYQFTYQGRFSHVYRPNSTIPYGVIHQDDLIYLFYMSALFPKFNVTDPEYKMVKKLTTLLANFVCAGDPIPRRTKELDNVDWIPFTPENNKYMDIGSTLQMKRNLNAERYAVWHRLFPLSDYE